MIWKRRVSSGIFSNSCRVSFDPPSSYTAPRCPRVSAISLIVFAISGSGTMWSSTMISARRASTRVLRMTLSTGTSARFSDVE